MSIPAILPKLEILLVLKRTWFLIFLTAYSFFLRAQSFESIHSRPDIPCQGSIKYNNLILPDSSLPVLDSRDTGIVVPWLNLNKGWNIQQDSVTPGNYFLTSASWFSNNALTDNWILFTLSDIPQKACLSFQAWSFDEEYPEDLEIWISEFSLTADSLNLGQKIKSLSVPHTKSWISIDLSAWAGLNRKIGIRHTSQNKFILGFDHILMTDVSQSGVNIHAAGFHRKPSLGDTMDLQLWISNESVDSADMATLVFIHQKNGLIEDSLSWDLSFPALSLNESALVTLEDMWIPQTMGNDTFSLYLKYSSYTSDTIQFIETVDFALPVSDIGQPSALTVWPNPAHYTLSFRSYEHWRIYDAKGELVVQGQGEEQTIQLNCQAWPSGIYYLKTELNSLGVKIIIQSDNK